MKDLKTFAYWLEKEGYLDNPNKALQEYKDLRDDEWRKFRRKLQEKEGLRG